MPSAPICNEATCPTAWYSTLCASGCWRSAICLFHRPVPDVHGRHGVVFADQVQADRLAAEVVVQPDAVAEQDRHDVQVDLVDQSQLEQLAADGRREHLEVLTAGTAVSPAARAVLVPRAFPVRLTARPGSGRDTLPVQDT